jgi:type IV pilus assembly protein PilE
MPLRNSCSRRRASPGWRASPGRRDGGFTLIELMVAVVIATVLISIAIPGYNTSIRKSRRTDAKTALLDLAGREERYYNTNNTYSALPSDLGYNGTLASFPMVIGNGYYLVNVAVVAGAGNVGPTYTITATPNTADQMLDTNCATFTVNNLGQQAATDGGGANTTSTCW